MPIHPTAIIHPDAQLASDVEIGPYVCIEGPAIIGEGCLLQTHAVLSGAVTLGKNNRIGYGTIIGGWPQDLAFQPERHSEVVIGDGNDIREHCTIHRATAEGGATRIGDHNFIMTGSHVGHESRIGNHAIMASNSALGGHAQVQDRAFLGGGAILHQFVRLGQLTMVQGLSGLSKDLPPFCIGALINKVAGLNVVGMRRAGFSAATRQEIKDAFQLVYGGDLNVTQALAAGRERTWGAEARSFFEFIEQAKKRGICGSRRIARGDSAREES